MCFSLTVLQHDTFYSEELLAPRPTPKLEDYPLWAVCDCLFNTFAATLHIGSCSSIRNLRTCHAMVIGTHLSWMSHHIKPKIITYCQSRKFEKWCKFSSCVKAKSYKKSRVQSDLPVYFEVNTLTA